MRENLVGQKFGSLEVLSDGGSRSKSRFWHCRCECGREIDVRQVNLKSGHTRSCGCKYSIKNTRHFVDGTCIEVIRSKTIFSNNTSGVRGVYWNKRSQRWVAQITFKGKTHNLGSYEKLEDAQQARIQAEQEMFHTFVEQYSVK